MEWPADEHRVIRHCDAAFELAVKGEKRDLSCDLRMTLSGGDLLCLFAERVTRDGFDEFMHGLINPQNSLWDRLQN